MPEALMKPMGLSSSRQPGTCRTLTEPGCGALTKRMMSSRRRSGMGDEHADGAADAAQDTVTESKASSSVSMITADSAARSGE